MASTGSPSPYRWCRWVARAGCASRCSGRSGPATARGATSPLMARCSAGCWRCWCSIVAGWCRRTRRSRRCGRGDHRGTRSGRCRPTCPGSVAACPQGSSSRRLRATRIAPARLDVDADRLADAVHRAVDIEDGEALATIDAILERWQGPAYPELADVDAGRAEAMALAELRIRAAETRAATPARRRSDRRVSSPSSLRWPTTNRCASGRASC